MEIGKTLYITERGKWREWLEANFDKEKEIWLVYPNKSTGKPRILYNDAVEEAICFGWIDSTIKKLDPEHAVQRFSPRRSKSTFSQANKERIRWLAKHDLIHPTILETLEPVLEEEFIYPEDILDEIRRDDEAWLYFKTLPESYKRIRIAYIDGARERPEEFRKRLRYFLEKTKKNELLPGFGGIDKYY